MECKSCKGKMVKKESIMSGNSKYITYICNKCGNTLKRCEGVRN